MTRRGRGTSRQSQRSFRREWTRTGVRVLLGGLPDQLKKRMLQDKMRVREPCWSLCPEIQGDWTREWLRSQAVVRRSGLQSFQFHGLFEMVRFL